MSLYVYLTIDTPMPRKASSGIFVRENGATVEITREEWDYRFPGREPVTVASKDDETSEVFHRNITHNLTKMADRAGLYMPCWQPDECGIKIARQLIVPLAQGLDRLIAAPDEFKPFNPSNGWGSYDGLVLFVGDYLKACVEHPSASVGVSR